MNILISVDIRRHQKELVNGFNKNPNKFYGYVRSIQKVHEEVLGIRRQDGVTTTSDLEAADELYCEFSRVFTRESILTTEGHINCSFLFTQDEVIIRLSGL